MTGKKITIDAVTYQYCLDEMASIHAMCDRAAIPKTAEGQPLSAGQRVAVLEEILAGLIANLGRPPMTIQH